MRRIIYFGSKLCHGNCTLDARPRWAALGSYGLGIPDMSIKAASLVRNTRVALRLVLIVVVNLMTALWIGKRWAVVIVSLFVGVRK